MSTYPQEFKDLEEENEKLQGKILELQIKLDNAQNAQLEDLDIIEGYIDRTEILQSENEGLYAENNTLKDKILLLTDI
ncbi:hypothetical protein LCGC14_2094470 [marine sediment metagenome]|uniref:Uncharacterized protein n=1 Tax=marine sediment metagenome TaxID=412755 RepID=A0A0F9H8J8_9ZZZZ